MIRTIVQLPDPILRQSARKVHRQRKQYIDSVIKDLFDTALDTDALGLAAPQIGVSLRIAVIRVGDYYQKLINPEITGRGDALAIATEGCLSLPPYIRVNVERTVKISLRDRYGTYKAENQMARVIQHEIDHLDGVLILDKEVMGEAQETGTVAEIL